MVRVPRPNNDCDTGTMYQITQPATKIIDSKEPIFLLAGGKLLTDHNEFVFANFLCLDLLDVSTISITI